MRRLHQAFAKRLLAGVALAGACALASAQGVSAHYGLTTPLQDPELTPRMPLLGAGPLWLSAASSTTGSGLSLQAGQRWFARVGVGRSLEADVMSVGGGYRFNGGDSLSMHVTRQLGQERLGLALRYDRAQAYLRLSYEATLRPMSGADTLRFSAGVRF